LVFALILLILGNTAALAEPPTEIEVLSSTDRKAMECLKPGLNALKNEEFDKAVRDLTSCVEKHSESGLARYWLGKAYFYQGKHSEAAEALKKAVHLEPNNYRPMYMLARVYSQDDKKLSLAQEILEKVLARNPEFNEARLALAHTLVKQGDIKRAFIQFRLIFSKEQDFARYHTELGRLLSALGQKEQAMKEFQRALVLSPEYERAKKYVQELENRPEAIVPKPADGKSQE